MYIKAESESLVFGFIFTIYPLISLPFMVHIKSKTYGLFNLSHGGGTYPSFAPVTLLSSVKHDVIYKRKILKFLSAK